MADPLITAGRGGWRSSLRTGGTLGIAGTLAAGGLSAFLAASATPASAADPVIVNSDGDVAVGDGGRCTDLDPLTLCTLRDALAAASTTGDVIRFESALSGKTIELTHGQLKITAGITVTGLGSSNLTVDAGGASRVFYVTSAASTDPVSISGLSIVNGDAGIDYGGGVFDTHTGGLILTATSITGNKAAYGAGVYLAESGALTIVDSDLSYNDAISTGGAFCTSGDGDLVITNSTFDHNTVGASGAAGIVESTTATIVGSTFTNNSSYTYGGALAVESEVTILSISDSTFRSNTTFGKGGALYLTLDSSQTPTDGMVTIDRTTFDGNTAKTGGAFYANFGVGDITITDSTFSDNTATGAGGYGGGAILLNGLQTLEINNSTLTGNVVGDGTETGNGGAIWLNDSASLVVNQSTIAGNTAYYGGAIWTNGGSITLVGSIVSANDIASPAPSGLSSSPVHDGADVSGSSTTTISSNHSIIGSVDSDMTVTNAGGTIISSDPGLMPLADNGGATFTMALAAGSVALDAGPDRVPDFDGNGFDQRGTPWVRVYNGRADIGAFEDQPDPGPDPDPSPTPSTTSTIAPDPDQPVGPNPDQPAIPNFAG